MTDEKTVGEFPDDEDAKEIFELPEQARVFPKSDKTYIVVNPTPYKGKKQVNLREFVIGPDYIGPTKSGLVVPAEKWKQFLTIVNSIKL